MSLEIEMKIRLSQELRSGGLVGFNDGKVYQCGVISGTVNQPMSECDFTV